jgi:hypothetical protein
VAEIIGDGRLAEEGSQQAGGTQSVVAAAPRGSQPVTLEHSTSLSPSPDNDEDRFARLQVYAALKVWPDLPRDAQERLFAAAVDDGLIANFLAVFLHDRHPKTAHPPKPTVIV